VSNSSTHLELALDTWYLVFNRAL